MKQDANYVGMLSDTQLLDYAHRIESSDSTPLELMLAKRLEEYVGRGNVAEWCHVTAIEDAQGDINAAVPDYRPLREAIEILDGIFDEEIDTEQAQYLANLAIKKLSSTLDDMYDLDDKIKKAFKQLFTRTTEGT